MAVIATLSKGYDLDYIWKQVDRSPARRPPGTTSKPASPADEPPESARLEFGETGPQPGYGRPRSPVAVAR